MLRVRHQNSGFTLIEVLVTVLIVAFGLLGLAALHGKTQLAEVESYQREQAIVIMQDMVQRISTNYSAATSYVTGTSKPLGTNDGQYTASSNCSGYGNLYQVDLCEWSQALQGAAEQQSGGTSVGAMIGARGCVEQLQAPVQASCTPGVYRISVAWQGTSSTAAPSLACAANLYGSDTNRRLISTNITVGMAGCTSKNAPSTGP